MIPLCLILGDSTGVGTAAALAAVGIQCEVHAREGAPSSEMLRQYRRGPPADVAMIALGSNDASSPRLPANLLALRRRVLATRVTWLAPYDEGASAVVRTIARAFGDTVVPLSAFVSRDGVHPISYRAVADTLGWRWLFNGTSTPRAAASPPLLNVVTRLAYRQAVVLRF